VTFPLPPIFPGFLGFSPFPSREVHPSSRSPPPVASGIEESPPPGRQECLLQMPQVQAWNPGVLAKSKPTVPPPSAEVPCPLPHLHMVHTDVHLVTSWLDPAPNDSLQTDNFILSLETGRVSPGSVFQAATELVCWPKRSQRCIECGFSGSKWSMCMQSAVREPSSQAAQLSGWQKA